MTTRLRKVEEGVYAVTHDGVFLGRVNRDERGRRDHGHVRWTGQVWRTAEDLPSYPTRREAVAGLIVRHLLEADVPPPTIERSTS